MQGVLVLSETKRGDDLSVTAIPRHSGHKKRCPVCRHIFTSSRSDAKYCSQACRQKAARKRTKPVERRRRQVATCAQCHEPFVSATATSRYCSQACRQAAYRDRQRKELAIAELVRLTPQRYSPDKVRQHVQHWSYAQLVTALERARAVQY